MSGPMLYYFPRVLTVTAKNCHDYFDRFGLSEILDGINLECRGVDSGPDGLNGCIISETPGARIGYYPDDQEWCESENGAYWIGFFKTAKPCPNDLARKEQYGGHLVKLADGSEWLVPVVRILCGGTSLPQAVKWGKNGEIIQEILPQYVELCRVGEEISEHVLEHGTISGTTEYLANIAVSALQINYKIGKWEASALSILTTTNIQKIIEAMIDVPTALAINELEKKNEAR